MTTVRQLVNSLGTSDNIIAGNPKMTYMREEYTRTTQRTNQIVTLQFNKNIYFGTEVTIDLYQEGDIIDAAWLQLTFPTVSQTSTAVSYLAGPITQYTQVLLAGSGSQTTASIAWSPSLGLFASVTNDSLNTNSQLYSSTGTSWTLPGTQVSGPWSTVVWSASPALFCAIGSGNYALTSTNGTSWSLGNSGQIIQYNTALATTGAGQFVSVGYAPTSTQLFSVVTSIAASVTTPWTSVTFTFTANPQIYGVINGMTVTTSGTVFTGKTLLVTGTTTTSITCSISPAFTTNQTVPLGTTVTVKTTTGTLTAYNSTNGTVWSQATQFGASTPAIAVTSIAWSPTLGIFVSVGTNSQAYDTSGAGNAWTAVSSPVTGTWTSVCWASDINTFVAVGTNQMMYSTSGTTWTLSSIPATGTWLSVTRGNGVFIATGSSGLAAISTDGSIWSVINVPVSSPFGASSLTASYYGISYSPSLNLFTIGGNYVYSYISAVTNTSTYTANTVVDSFGTYSLNWVQLEYGNQIIERLHGEYIEMFNDVTVPQGKQGALSNLVGKNLTSNLAVYYVKLPFSSFKYGLPVCALKENPRIRFNIRNFYDCAPGLTSNINPLFNATLAVDYIFLPEEERNYFINNSLEYLVGQNQFVSTQISLTLPYYSTIPFSLPLTSLGTSSTATFSLPLFSYQAPTLTFVYTLNAPTFVSMSGISFTLNGVTITPVSSNKGTTVYTATFNLTNPVMYSSNNVVTYATTGTVSITSGTLAISGTYIGGGSIPYSIYTEFRNPCKELFFVFQKSTAQPYDFTLDGTNDILSSMRIVLNGSEYLKAETGTPQLLHTIKGLDRHVRIPDRKFYMYTFCIDPENNQPSGDINMSMITRQQFDFSLNMTGCPVNMRMYMRSYNIMKIHDGSLAMLFYGPTDDNIFIPVNIQTIPKPIVTLSGTYTQGTSGIYTYVIFTGNGTFTINYSLVADILVVGGGGGSGGDYNNENNGGYIGYAGGGGAVVYKSSVSLVPQTYQVLVGAGGAAGTEGYGEYFGQNILTSPTQGSNGGRSSFGSVAAANGGGGGGTYPVKCTVVSGGSAASIVVPLSLYIGATGSSGGSGYVSGSGTAGQGYAGSSGGGGGAGTSGTSTTGGNGTVNSILGCPVFYGGGGGNGADGGPGFNFPYNGNQGGAGGGGIGGYFSYSAPVSTTGTGGTNGLGGGAGSMILVNGSTGVPLSGGSGVVIIRYKT